MDKDTIDFVAERAALLAVSDLRRRAIAGAGGAAYDAP